MSLALWNRAGPAIHVPRGVQRPRWPFTLNKDSPQADGLIAWWPVWAGGGDTLHAYGGLVGIGSTLASNGTLLGNVVWSAEPGGFLNVVEFFGGFSGSDYISIPFFFNPNSGPGSIIAWAFATEHPSFGDGNRNIWQQENNGGTGRSWLQSFNPGSGDTRVSSFLGGTRVNGATNINGRLNDWMHLATTWASGGSGTARVYLDGVEDGSGTIDPETCTGNYRLGAHKAPISKNENWDGSLCDVRIYNVECPASILYQAWDPSRRWDMYYELNRIYYSFPVAVAAPVVDAFIPAGGHMGIN